MEDKINIAELIKDCPKGMELDCTIFEGVVFHDIVDRHFPIRVRRKEGGLIELTANGCIKDKIDAKCVIFPKGKTTWEGFVPPCKFKNGDVVATDSGRWLGIIKNKYDFEYYTVHCAIDYTFNDIFYRCGEYCFSRLATEEEKAALFNAIKANGYKWNPETKTLEKLIDPKFNIEKGKWYVCIKDLLDNYANKAFRKGDTYLSTQDGSLIPSNSNVPFEVVCPGTYFRDWTIQDAKEGDVLAFNDEIIVIFKDLSNKTSFHSYCHIEDGIFTISEEDMPDWWAGRGFYPATKEQCNIFFQKIKAAGYEWTTETKTLGKLIESKEDTDDGIVNDEIVMSGIYFDREYYADEVELHLNNYEIEIRDGKTYAIFKNQETKTLKPEFKVGDRIRQKTDLWPSYRTIKSYDKNIGYFTTINDWVRIEDQDDWELVPNKFDITTLKPFDSRVLVRHSRDNKWCASFFSHLDEDFHSHCYKFVTTSGKSYPMCIPYEGNEHLLDKTDDCDEYFKTWK